MLPDGIQPLGTTTSGPENSFGGHQVLVEEGIPSREANNLGTASRVWYERSGRSSGGRAVQPIGCTVCIDPRRVARKHREPDRNERRTAASDHSTTVAAAERQQLSAGNVCAPRPTAHDECNANATTVGTRKKWTIWRTWRVDAATTNTTMDGKERGDSCNSSQTR